MERGSSGASGVTSSQSTGAKSAAGSVGGRLASWTTVFAHEFGTAGRAPAWCPRCAQKCHNTTIAEPYVDRGWYFHIQSKQQVTFALHFLIICRYTIIWLSVGMLLLTAN